MRIGLEELTVFSKFRSYLDLPDQHFNFVKWRFKRHHIPVDLICSSPEKLTLPENYGIIFSQAVLEHLIDT